MRHPAAHIDTYRRAGRSTLVSGAVVDERPLVGVDIGGTKLLLVALLRDRCELHRVPTVQGIGPEFVEGEVRSFLSRLGPSPAALGVAIPGLVDATGLVTGCSTFPGLENWRAEKTFADLGCPVRVLNDVDAALVEETHDLDPDATAAIVLAGTAIGAAIRTRGGRLRGARGWAGELGFAPISFDGGRVLRLDDLAGGGALTRRLETDGATLYALAERGDPVALGAVREAGHALGLGLATVVNLINPGTLALGGGAFKLRGYREAALESAERWSLPDSWESCDVRLARAGDAVVALGAIRAALSGEGP